MSPYDITIDDIAPFCSGCGCEITTDTWGLCASCEENIQQADSAWTPKQKEDE